MELFVNTEDYKSAKEQQAEEWLEVSSEPYVKLPKITGPGFGDSLELLDPEFNSMAFTEKGNTMNGRTKHIHKFGVLAKMKFVSESNVFTGIFTSGAEYAVIRFSLAKPAEEEGWFSDANITPGFAVKYYVDKNAPLSSMAMPGLGGQKEANFFAFEYKNNLSKPPFSVKLKALECSFTKSLELQGQENGNPRHLTSDDIASITSKGEKVNNPKVPYDLIYTPTREAKELMRDHKVSEDFRAALINKGKGVRLFNVYGREYKKGPRLHIGYYEATSDFIASEKVDDMYFKHPKCHDID